MTASELRELIRRGEDSRTQFKRLFNSIDALAVEIAAMLNSDGGWILVGVSDSGEVVGVQELRQLNSSTQRRWTVSGLAFSSSGTRSWFPSPPNCGFPIGE